MSQIHQLETEQPSQPIFKVTNLNLSFEAQRGIIKKEKSVIKALDNVSLEIGRTEILSVVGESGCGKTSLARCLMGLAKPSSGSVKYENIEVTSLGRKQLRNYWRHVQTVFQDPFESLNPRQSVRDTVSTPIRALTGENDRSSLATKISQILWEVGLNPDKVMHKLPHQLSGGERQRVNIARALAPDPSVLIADEPITMLDASQRLNILLLLKELRTKRNLTVILITHDLASAKVMSDRTAVMYLGKLVELGSTSEVLSKPHHPYTDLIIRATPTLASSQPMSYQKTIANGGEGSCIFTPRCKYSTTVCREVSPELVEKSKNHFAACHNPLGC